MCRHTDGELELDDRHFSERRIYGVRTARAIFAQMGVGEVIHRFSTAYPQGIHSLSTCPQIIHSIHTCYPHMHRLYISTCVQGVHKLSTGV